MNKFSGLLKLNGVTLLLNIQFTRDSVKLPARQSIIW
jgi:hypothetical protein